MSTHPETLRPAPSADTVSCWLAGIRYPSGTEIWCAYRGGEPAWTPDRKLAATYASEASAALAARLLADATAVPFWTPLTMR